MTGASRGIGRGIAVELGAAGMKVYCLARSTRRGGATTERSVAADVEATLEATCEEIAALGGQGVAVRYDALDDAAFRGVVAQAREDCGRLDVLVCSAFTTPPRLDDAAFRDDFWKQGVGMWEACHGVGLKSAYVACCEAAPLMIETAKATSQRPLIALISSFGGKSYTFNVAYGVGKAATDRLARDMAVQLAKHGVDTTSLYPGVVQTEGNLEMDRKGEWAAASGNLDLTQGESPRFSGRALVELLLRPDRTRRDSGKVQVVAELADEFDFDDPQQAGKRPPSIRSLSFILPNFVLTDAALDGSPPVLRDLLAKVKANVPNLLLPWAVFESGPPPDQPS